MAEDRLGPVIDTAFNKLTTTAAASGYFDRVQAHEPKSSTGTGMTFCCWLGNIRPIALQSGLAATSARTLIMCRIYLPMLTEPQDDIDVTIGKASSYMLAQLTGDFLEGTTWIDLLGAYGVLLEAQPGYVKLDSDTYRIVNIPVPFISPDVFDQEA